MGHRIRLAGLAIAGALAAGWVFGVGAQEVTGGATTTAKPMSKSLVSITQPMLNSAAGDPKNWIHSNGSYEQTRYYTGNQINAGNRAR